MIDAKRLLDQFLGSGAGGSLGSGLGGLLGDLQRGGGAGGAPGDARQRVGGGVLDGVQRQARENPLATGVIAGGLAAILLGSKGKGLTGSAVKLGGLGLIGGLAYKAYQDWQAKQAGQSLPSAGQPELLPPPKDTPFAPADNEAEDRARLLLTAMIAAAKADGHIDAAEQKRIFDRLGAVELDAESKAYLMDQLRAPLDLDGIVRQASQPEVATEVYAASLLAIDPDHPAEKAYLQMLAARLGLADELIQEIHRTAEGTRVPA